MLIGIDDADLRLGERVVFIQPVGSPASSFDLQLLLQKAGPCKYCTILRESNNDNAKAIAIFQEAQHAHRALYMFKDEFWSKQWLQLSRTAEWEKPEIANGSGNAVTTGCGDDVCDTGSSSSALISEL